MSLRADDPRVVRKFSPPADDDIGYVWGRLDPGECRHLDCEERATRRVINAFGMGNFCEGHAEEFSPHAEVGFPVEVAGAHPAWAAECFRYGPAHDP